MSHPCWVNGAYTADRKTLNTETAKTFCAFRVFRGPKKEAYEKSSRTRSRIIRVSAHQPVADCDVDNSRTIQVKGETRISRSRIVHEIGKGPFSNMLAAWSCS